MEDLIAQLQATVAEHGMATLAAVSVAGMVISLAVIAAALYLMPADYFAHEGAPPQPWSHRGRAARTSLRVGRNAFGALLLAAGLVMLALPGQGMLTILVALILLEFPGKRSVERGIARRQRVLSSLNSLRGRLGRPPFAAPS